MVSWIKKLYLKYNHKYIKNTHKHLCKVEGLQGKNTHLLTQNKGTILSLVFSKFSVEQIYNH